jgi:hypothetical protein
MADSTGGPPEIGLAVSHGETMFRAVSTNGLHHSRHRHRHKSFRNVNYEELPEGSRPKAQESDPYLEQLDLLRQEQRSLLKQTALLNLLFLLSVIACLWFGAMWVFSKYPPPESPDISPTVTFRN